MVNVVCNGWTGRDRTTHMVMVSSLSSFVFVFVRRRRMCVQAERRAYEDELEVMKAFLAENNLPDMLGKSSSLAAAVCLCTAVSAGLVRGLLDAPLLCGG